MHPQRKAQSMRPEVEKEKEEKEQNQYNYDIDGLQMLLASKIRVESLKDDQLNRYERILMEAPINNFETRDIRILQSIVLSEKRYRQSEKRHREEVQRYNTFVEELKKQVKQVNKTVRSAVAEAFKASKDERSSKLDQVQDHVKHIQSQLTKKQSKKISNFFSSIKNFFVFSRTSYPQSSQEQVDTSLLSPLITEQSQLISPFAKLL